MLSAFGSPCQAGFAAIDPDTFLSPESYTAAMRDRRRLRRRR
jgi:hypothetical protein